MSPLTTIAGALALLTLAGFTLWQFMDIWTMKSNIIIYRDIEIDQSIDCNGDIQYQCASWNIGTRGSLADIKAHIDYYMELLNN